MIPIETTVYFKVEIEMINEKKMKENLNKMNKTCVMSEANETFTFNEI